jgi:hypothetical protein
MGLIDDPISGLIGVFFKRALDSKIAQRATLLLEMGISTTLTGAFATGGALLAHQAIAWSIGLGLVGAAVAGLATFQASPNSKGLTIAVRHGLASEKMETPITTINRS